MADEIKNEGAQSTNEQKAPSAPKAPKAASAPKAPAASKTPGASKAKVADNQFEHEGKKFKVIIPQVNIPEIGIRTALEICTDPEAQAKLIELKCIGSVIEEVIE